MGKRGPKKTPKDILRLRGSWRGDIPDDASADPLLALPPCEKLRCPSFLSKEGKRLWKTLEPALRQLGILHQVDRTSLILLCTCWSDYREAQASVTALNGKTVYTLSNGTKGQEPAFKIRDEAFVRLRKLTADFGCVPSARGGITLPTKPKAKDEDITKSKARFFQGPFESTST